MVDNEVLHETREKEYKDIQQAEIDGLQEEEDKIRAESENGK